MCVVCVVLWAYLFSTTMSTPVKSIEKNGKRFAIMPEGRGFRLVQERKCDSCYYLSYNFTPELPPRA